jgi:hypothetical protein
LFCFDFALNPLLEKKEINLSLSVFEWQQLAHISSTTNIAEQLKNHQIEFNLALSHQIWQHVADSSTNPHLLNQLQSHGFERQGTDDPDRHDVFDWIEVDSSCISAIGYDAVYSTLRIRFNSGDVYEYEDFQVNEFLQFRDAHSKGRFFHSKIKNLYVCTRI